MPLTMRLCGAARTVTGSCLMFETGHHRFLVDCGMFQGPKTLKALNYARFPFRPREIDVVLLTHAHIDHSGLLPKLVKAGFSGPILATRGTIDLCGIMLPDSGHIQEMEVKQLNRRNAQRGRDPVTPIYGVAEAIETLNAFRPVDYGVWMPVVPGVRARYWNAGHILGSASIELEFGPPVVKETLRLLVSGDIGSQANLLQPDPEAPEGIDWLVCESTYGDTDRPDTTPGARLKALAHEMREAWRQDGALLIPAFAVERTQELLVDLIGLMRDKTVPEAPIFLDSPLASKATDVFVRHREGLEGGGELAAAVGYPRLHFTETVDESKAIARVRGFHVIIAGSGMCEAGRIRHHLKRWLWSADATVLMVGFQAQGTLGRLLTDGAGAVRIMGEEIRVKARIRKIDDYSGHADAPELMRWIAARRPVRRGVVLVHGEEEAMDALAGRLRATGIDGAVCAPVLDDVIDLTEVTPKPCEPPERRRLAPEQVGRLDWHNDLSKLLLDISGRIDEAADDRARGVVIRRLRRALEREE